MRCERQAPCMQGLVIVTCALFGANRSMVTSYGCLSLPQHLDTALQMAKTQKNKATSGHLGLLKVRNNLPRGQFIKMLVKPYSGSSGGCTVLPHC
jgi:hypothetical protein